MLACHGPARSLLSKMASSMPRRNQRPEAQEAGDACRSRSAEPDSRCAIWRNSGNPTSCSVAAGRAVAGMKRMSTVAEQMGYPTGPDGQPLPPLKFGRCLHPGLEKLAIEFQEYVWLDGPLVDKSQLTNMLRMWELSRPNLVIELIGGYCHPKHMLLPADIDTLQRSALGKVVSDAKRVLELQSGTPDVDMAQLQRMVGNSLYDRLIEAMVALVEACSATNCWIMIDMPNIGQMPFILEQALHRTKSRPVIILFVDPTVKGKFRTGKHSYQDGAWKLLEEGAKEVHLEETLARLQMQTLSDDLFPPGEEWWPVPEDEAPVEAAERNTLWKSHYGRWFFRAASHYIFCPCAGSFNSSAVPFPLEWLGKSGTVFSCGAIGQGCVSDMIFDSLDNGKPTILLKYTGQAADLWSHVLDSMKSLAETGELSLDGGAAKIMERMHEKLGSEAREQMMQNTWTGRSLFPSLRSLLRKDWSRLEQTFVVVDCFKDAPDSVLDKVSSCFSSSCGCSFLLGTENVRARCIDEAQMTLSLLRYNARRFAIFANLMAVGGVVLSMLSTLIAASSAWMDLNLDAKHAFPLLHSFSHMALVVLPALAGLAFTLLSRLRYMSKWGTVHLAAQQVESEIYKFRIQAGEYNPLDGQEQAMQSPAVLASKIAAIYGTIKGEFHHDSLYVPERTGDDVDCLMGFTESCSAEPPGREAMEPLLIATAALRPAEASESAQILTSITIEEYFDQRLAEKLKYWQVLAPKLSRRVALYEALIVMASVLGTVLGALDQKLWIPFMVAIGAAMNSLMHHEGLQGRLAALNSSIQDLVTIRHKWSACGVLERRTPSMKQWIVDITEGAVLREAYAYTTTAGPASKSLDGPEGSEEAQDPASPKMASPKTGPFGKEPA